MLIRCVMVIRIVMTVPMRSKSFAIESSVRMVSFDVTMVLALPNRKSAMEFVTVPMVRMKFNVVEENVAVGECKRQTFSFTL